MTKHDVSVVGLYVIDVHGYEIKSIPDAGSGQFIDDIKLTVAGTAGGTVIDCAHFGLNCYAVGAIGDDDIADFIYMKLKKMDVDTRGLNALQDINTSASIIASQSDGERRHWHAPASAKEFTLSRKIAEQAFQSKIIHVGGTGLLNKFDGEPCRDFLAEAKKRGCITTLDLIFAEEDTAKNLELVLPYIDYFIPSIDEARVLSGLSPVESIAEYYLNQGVKNCLITLGDKGSFITTCDNDAYYIPAVKDVNVLDTTGCGDAYTAGIIIGLKYGWSLKFSACFATIISGQVATGLGSNAGLTSFDKALEIAQEYFNNLNN